MKGTKREIVIAVASAAVGALLTFLIVVLSGHFRGPVTDSRILGEVSRMIAGDERFNEVLAEKLESRGLKGLQGERGEVGPRGVKGPPGPDKELVCRTVREDGGPEAICPEEFVVTGCSAGGDGGSIRHRQDRCVNESPHASWTEARCCALRRSETQ